MISLLSIHSSWCKHVHYIDLSMESNPGIYFPLTFTNSTISGIGKKIYPKCWTLKWIVREHSLCDSVNWYKIFNLNFNSNKKNPCMNKNIQNAFSLHFHRIFPSMHSIFHNTVYSSIFLFNYQCKGGTWMI